MTETTILSDDLRHQVEELARKQNRTPADILEEAVRRYAGAAATGTLRRKSREKRAGAGH